MQERASTIEPRPDTGTAGDLSNALDDYEQTIAAMLDGESFHDSDLPERLAQARAAKRYAAGMSKALADLLPYIDDCEDAGQIEAAQAQAIREVVRETLNGAGVGVEEAHRADDYPLDVATYRSEMDGALCVQIDGPHDENDLNADTSPRMRIYLNDATIYEGA